MTIFLFGLAIQGEFYAKKMTCLPDFATLCALNYFMHARSSENLEMKAFEKFENAVFFKIFKIPSDRQLILV